MIRRLLPALCAAALALPCFAQNRGVYPLGMSATNSGVTPAPGWTYGNQLIYYSRDHAKDDDGNTKPVTGENLVLMDMNTFAWVSDRKILGGANFSMFATLPFAKNSLTSDINGRISGGSGFADSYYVPVVFGWNRDRVNVRAMYGFLAPTGRFKANANDNVGSGYWTHALSSGQTFRLDASKTLSLSTFEMYELHTKQKETDVKPGDTLDLDYSLMKSFGETWQAGIAGYNAWQTTARTGPGITEAQSSERYVVNALGVAISNAFPKHKAGITFKAFKEFSNRSTFQGYSGQLLGSIAF